MAEADVYKGSIALTERNGIRLLYFAWKDLYRSSQAVEHHFLLSASDHPMEGVLRDPFVNFRISIALSGDAGNDCFFVEKNCNRLLFDAVAFLGSVAWRVVLTVESGVLGAILIDVVSRVCSPLFRYQCSLF